MKTSPMTMPTVLASLLATLLLGCAATSVPQDKLEQRTATAIGRGVGNFTITNQKMEEGGRMNYSVATSDGASYQCYLYEAPAMSKVVTLGMAPTTSDAICTPNVSGRSATTPAKPATSSAACNALLKAAGKC